MVSVVRVLTPPAGITVLDWEDLPGTGDAAPHPRIDTDMAAILCISVGASVVLMDYLLPKEVVQAAVRYDVMGICPEIRTARSIAPHCGRSTLTGSSGTPVREPDPEAL
ncbi:MAG: hypothetical protein U5K56_13080 [Halioglobus sp.]|nr:hypothetical protein [Halioglobus sp.]